MNSPERDELMASNEAYRKLVNEHSNYSQKIESLVSKKYPSEEEKVEVVRLKKLKLRIKDEIETFRIRAREMS